MPASVRKRKQGTVDFSANNKITIPLSRGMIYRELYLRLQGAATTTGVNNTTANTQRGDEWGVIKKIEVIANGTDVVKSIDGNALWWLNYFIYGTLPKITAAFGDGATANPPFDSVLILPFWSHDTVNPMDTALPSDTLSSLELSITWGTYTDINSAATAWTTEPTVEVYSAECFNVKGTFSNLRVFKIEKEITATNSEFTVDLPVGPMYRGFLLNTTDGDADQADILNNFKIVSASTVFADVHAQDDVLIQAERIRRGLPRFWDDGAGAYDTFRRGDANDIDGWYWYDQVMDGLLTESIDALGLSELKIVADVTVGAGTTKLYVYPFQVIPPRGANNG